MSKQSKQNVELHYRSIDAVNRRDFSAFLSLMDDEVEAVSRIVAMEGGLHGHEGVRRWWEEWLAAFPDYQIEVDENPGSWRRDRRSHARCWSWCR